MRGVHGRVRTRAEAQITYMMMNEMIATRITGVRDDESGTVHFRPNEDEIRTTLQLFPLRTIALLFNLHVIIFARQALVTYIIRGYKFDFAYT